MAIVRGYNELSKLDHYKTLKKNPFWKYLIGICGIFFIAANSTPTYVLSIAISILCLGIIGFAYFGEELHLHNRAFRQLKSLDDAFVILPSLKLTDGYEHGCTSYIIISPKGVFNIKILDFTGVLTGNSDDKIWNFVDYSYPYQPQHKKIRNPLRTINKSHKIIEELLNRNHIDYLFLRSIFVIKNSHSKVISDTNIPIVKLKALNEYLLGYQDRPHHESLLEVITASILEGQYGNCCKKLFCTDS